MTLFALLWISGTIISSSALANHGAHTPNPSEHQPQALGQGHPVSGAPFQVYFRVGNIGKDRHQMTDEQVSASLQTVVEAFTLMAKNRTQYQRFDEALSKGALEKVILEPRVYNREGKEFTFLVARTTQPGKVNLLINARAIEEHGYVHHPKKLLPVLAKEFQWVVIKADTSPKRKSVTVSRNLTPRCDKNK